MFVDVIVDISLSKLDKVFEYQIPDEAACPEIIGRQVLVPFGNGNRQMRGLILGLHKEPRFDPKKIKWVIRIEEEAPSADASLLRLADRIRSRNGCTMNQALKTVLPVKKQVKEVVRKTYVPADPEGIRAYRETCRFSKNLAARLRFIDALIDQGSLPYETARGVLQISDATIKSVLKTGFVKEICEQTCRMPSIPVTDKWKRNTLNADQEAACQAITSDMVKIWQGDEGAKPVHLLYGVTGSGKTEVYMELIERVLLEGKQVIVLIPEISLTLQTVSRFYSRFGNRIAIMNSRMSDGERFDQYNRVKNGEADIMIGPRSALFAPFSDIGLIIIDEEHDSAYKSDQVPKYHAAQVATWRAKMSGALVVLGSATPSVLTFQKAKSGEWGLQRLPNRAKDGAVMPEVAIVDMRHELRLKNKGMFSGKLFEEMKGALERKEQIMLFINRRGMAGFVSCRSCGEVMECPHCAVSMTAHRDGRLYCHYCGYSSPMPKKCPSCGSPFIAAFGVGTEKVEDFVHQCFPEAKTLRADRDTTAKKGAVEQIMKAFAEGEADILIGTQMIVKGHDFENVTVVGIVAADLSLFESDYRSAETTYQLLSQAAGRAGRGEKRGKVIIQTYQPEHYALVKAAAHDYEGFFEEEILLRRMLGYPPFEHMMLISAEGPDEAGTALVMKLMADVLLRAETFRIMGPAPAPVSKVKDQYRFQMYVKHKDEDKLIRAKDHLEQMMDRDGRFKDIFITFDLHA